MHKGTREKRTGHWFRSNDLAAHPTSDGEARCGLEQVIVGTNNARAGSLSSSVMTGIAGFRDAAMPRGTLPKHAT